MHIIIIMISCAYRMHLIESNKKILQEKMHYKPMRMELI
jgi:hypothetical protein